MKPVETDSSWYIYAYTLCRLYPPRQAIGQSPRAARTNTRINSSHDRTTQLYESLESLERYLAGVVTKCREIKRHRRGEPWDKEL